MKIVINSCYGGFGLSREAIDLYCAKKAKYSGESIQTGKWNATWGYYDKFHCRDIKRNDPFLVEVVESLGEKASGACAELRVVEIPDNVDWYVNDYDGMESIHETHRIWD
jgi:hypothetical protein